MITERSNEESYNNAEIVKYYSDFVSVGLFRYEELLIDKFFLAPGCRYGLFKKYDRSGESDK